MCSRTNLSNPSFKLTSFGIPHHSLYAPILHSPSSSSTYFMQQNCFNARNCHWNTKWRPAYCIITIHMYTWILGRVWQKMKNHWCLKSNRTSDMLHRNLHGPKRKRGKKTVGVAASMANGFGADVRQTCTRCMLKFCISAQTQTHTNPLAKWLAHRAEPSAEWQRSVWNWSGCYFQRKWYIFYSLCCRCTS